MQLRNPLLRLILDLPRWALLALIILTPWAFGGIPLWVQVVWIRVGLFIGLACLITAAARRQLTLPSWWWALPVLWILLEGWGMTWNARFVLLPQFAAFARLPQPHVGWPGSFEQESSWRLMQRVSVLLLLGLVVLDLARRSTWRKRLIYALLLAGGSVATFGLAMRIISPSGIWPDHDRNNYPFATFYYHANAAAYLNTVLPIAFACLARSLFTSAHPLAMALFVCVFLVLAAGALVCASKAGMVIAILLILVMVFVFWITFRGRFDRMTFALPPIVLWMVLAGVIALFVVVVGQQAILQRWQHVMAAGQGVMAGRRLAADVCYRVLPEAGWWGFGPGTFPWLFPAMARQQHIVLHEVWPFAHQDYLQTILEWGRSGAIAWGMLLGGSLIRGVGHRRFWSVFRRYDRILVYGLILSVGGCAVHALVDYPFQITAIELNLIVVMSLLWSCPRWELRSRIRRRQGTVSEIEDSKAGPLSASSPSP